MSRRRLIPLLATFLCLLQISLLLLAFLEYQDSPRPLNPMLAAILALANVLMLAAITYHLLVTLDRIEQSYETEVEEQLDDALVRYLAAAHEQKDEIRSLESEIAEELERARTALAANDATSMDRHLKQGLTLASQAIPTQCPNATVAAILNSKQRQCADTDVELDAQANLPAELPFLEIELASIFFNLIDNALHECVALREEEAERSETVMHPIITVRSSIQASQLLISVENPCRPSFHHHHGGQRQGELSRRHGWGTKIVSSLAERHGGIAEFTQDGVTFTARVLIPLVS